MSAKYKASQTFSSPSASKCRGNTHYTPFDNLTLFFGWLYHAIAPLIHILAYLFFVGGNIVLSWPAMV
jgi:hypothetical protein